MIGNIANIGQILFIVSNKDGRIKKKTYFCFLDISYDSLTVINYTLIIIIRKLIGENEHNNRNQ